VILSIKSSPVVVNIEEDNVVKFISVLVVVTFVFDNSLEFVFSVIISVLEVFNVVSDSVDIFFVTTVSYYAVVVETIIPSSSFEIPHPTNKEKTATKTKYTNLNFIHPPYM
jgi:hypothetical protein